jgi:hypothetical protein
LFAREGASIVVNDLGGPRDGSGGDKSMAQKVVDAIATTGVDRSDRPTEPVVIESITVS